MQNKDDSTKTWRLFMLNISLIIILFLSGIFLGFVLRTNRIIEEQMFTTARSHFKNIVLTRRWNADHGGVYVEKTKGVTSNPYLENPDIITTDGKIYTKKNPALMTREISEYAKRAGDFVYHITSLKPLNPKNIPDDFEEQALKKFEKGEKEFFIKETINDKTFFRYMSPLLVENSCMKCHAKQGYKSGDIRGGISVSFDISKIQKQMKTNKFLITLISFLTASLLISIIFMMISRLAKKLTSANQTIALMAITDELTQIYNRRYFHSSLDREINRSQRYSHPLSLLMLDIDHFKRINDTYGHQTGDEVLIGVAETVKNSTRQTDIVARYGGEEIAVILPETDIDGAFECSDKIRQNIENKFFEPGDGKSFHMTVSIGISSITQIKNSTEKEAKNIIKRADEALYKAKKNGRNQVVKQL